MAASPSYWTQLLSVRGSVPALGQAAAGLGEGLVDVESTVPGTAHPTTAESTTAVMVSAAGTGHDLVFPIQGTLREVLCAG